MIKRPIACDTNFERTTEINLDEGLEYNVLWGTLVSNDKGYDKVSDVLRENLQSKDSGVAFFIGSGGFLSMLPNLNVNEYWLVDKDVAVLEYNRALMCLILESESAEEVLYKLSHYATISRFPILRSILDEHGTMEITIGMIRSESITYGKDHWTDSDRFSLVKACLSEKKDKISFLAGDLSKTQFTEAMQDYLLQNNLKISFYNLSNIHHYLLLDIEKDGLQRLLDLEYDKNLTVLFSSHAHAASIGSLPHMRLVNSKEEYENEVYLDPKTHQILLELSKYIRDE